MIRCLLFSFFDPSSFRQIVQLFSIIKGSLVLNPGLDSQYRGELCIDVTVCKLLTWCLFYGEVTKRINCKVRITIENLNCLAISYFKLMYSIT